MNEIISRAPMAKRVQNKIMPIGTDDVFFMPKSKMVKNILMVDNTQTVITGLFTSVEADSIVVDSGASFTPDLLGKTIIRLSSTDNTNTDGTVTRAPDGNGNPMASGIITEVISSTKLRLNTTIFRNGASLYYAIDNHTGEILTSVDGFITTDTAGKLIDANANFDNSLVGKYALVYDGRVWFRQLISSVDSTTQLTLANDLNTTVGFTYKIVISDDSFRYIQSAANAVENINAGYTISVIIKDGTYREIVHYNGRSQMKTPQGGTELLGIAFIGNNIVASTVIMIGSYATTPTTKYYGIAFNFSNANALISGISTTYYGSSFCHKQGFVIIEKGTISNQNFLCVDSTGQEIITNVKLDTLGFGILSSHGELFVKFEGAIEIATNMYLTSPFCIGATVVTVNNPTISGAGVLDGGQSKFPTFISHWNGAVTFPHVSVGSSIWEGYFETAKSAATASAGAGTLPATPEGFIEVYVNGTLRKIPYYPA